MSTTTIEVGDVIRRRAGHGLEVVTKIVWSDAVGRAGYSVWFDSGADHVGWKWPTATDGVLDGTYVNDGRGSGADRLDSFR